MSVPFRSALLYALALWASTLVLTLLGPDRAALLPALVAYSAGFLALGGLWIQGGEIVGRPQRMLALAIILRLTVFWTIPDLSDDIYRYVWDGWLTASGVNPFRYVPSDAALAAFQQSDLFNALNSADYYSIYPPLSQLVFALAGIAYRGGGFLAAAYTLKAVFAVMEIAGVALLTSAAVRTGTGVRAVALYALNPLTLVTLTAGGHTESGLVLGMGILAWALAAQRGRLAWIGLALAAATKGLPLLFAPLLFRYQVGRGTSPGRVLRASMPAVLLGVLMLAPFYFDGFVAAIVTSADLYVRLFEFNAGFYRILEGAGFLLTGEDLGYRLGPILRMGFLVATGWIWVRWALPDVRSVLVGCLAITAIYLVTATTVHPWYLVWGLVLVPFAEGTRRAWVFASWAAFTTYFTYAGTPEWLPSTLFWAGVAAFALADAERGIRDRLLRIAGRRKAGQIAPYMKDGRVLDLGAGEGYVSAALASPGHTPILLDIGPHSHVDLPSVVYDGRNIPFGDGTFETVFASVALHHARDPDRVLEEAVRVAKGRIVVTESTFQWEWERRLLTLVDRFANRLRGEEMPSGRGARALGAAPVSREPESLQFRRVERWEDAFRHLGLEIVRSERLNRVGHRHHLFVLDRTRGPADARVSRVHTPTAGTEVSE